LPHSELLAELAPLAALDALDGAEREQFAAHLLSCRTCEHDVRSWQRDLASLGRGVASVPPSGLSRARLRSSAAFDVAARNRSRSPRAAAWLPVAASLALIVVATDDVVRRRAASSTARENARLSAENAGARRALAEREMRARFFEDPDVQAILLTGLGPQPGARGRVIYSPKARRAIFLAADLAPIPADRQYELWFLAAGSPIAAGAFDRAEGRATVFESALLPDSAPPAGKFAVTIEPRGGVARPTGPMVLAGG
jgi:anti-sigma-K factor RskA